MSFRYSRHALDEMVRRGIPQQMVDDLLANPQQVVIGIEILNASTRTDNPRSVDFAVLVTT
jgi:hypothetical protein